MTPLPREPFKRRIQGMDPYRFEELVADLWAAKGWTTRVTDEANDWGIDVVATRPDPVAETHLLQVKRYGPETPVGSPEVQQYASLREQKREADVVCIVTSGRFSDRGESVARDLNVKLVDGDDLYDLVESNALWPVVTDHLGTPGAARSGQQTAGAVEADAADTDNGDADGPLLPVDDWLDIDEWSSGMTALAFVAVLSVFVVVAGAAAGIGNVAGGPTEPRPATTPTAGDLERTATTTEPTSTARRQPAGSGERTLDAGGEDGVSALAPGTSRTADGLRVTVSEVTVARDLEDISPAFGSTDAEHGYLIARVRVENVDDRETRLPTRIRLFAGGRRIGQYATSDETFTHDGREYTRYPSNQFFLRATPGETISGWTVYRLPAAFDRADAFLQVGSDEQFRWRAE